MVKNPQEYSSGFLNATCISTLLILLPGMRRICYSFWCFLGSYFQFVQCDNGRDISMCLISTTLFALLLMTLAFNSSMASPNSSSPIIFPSWCTPSAVNIHAPEARSVIVEGNWKVLGSWVVAPIWSEPVQQSTISSIFTSKCSPSLRIRLVRTTPSE